jgi:hypothetical protein
MASVFKLVREQMVSRLRSGWEAKLAARQGDYSVEASDITKLATIDWQQSHKAKQLIIGGPLDWDELQSTTAIKYPAVQVYAYQGQDDGESKFMKFSGTVTGCVEFAWTWRQGNALPVFDEVPDLIQDVLVELFRDQAWLGALGQSGLTHNAGSLSLAFGPIQEAASNWRQIITLTMRFGVDV